ncbi:monocarboxylate transporter 13-like isoform X1 [Mya arenaria]|uniref:monocarboxylate transporter 13-like isoform X1 n=2 Tax=Mya arenaria TaxID=6604 RepID=UPI0022E68F4A|nr:monocarboxylate transporter 13-like isoform X1 [Mya arenaria]XP_052782560.1 monocarboxylate transporter 13-like isoform X1 [Mya arenaria]
MRPSDDVDRGWAWVVAACSFALHVMTYGLAWSTGVYQVIFLEAFVQPKSVTAWAGSLPTAVMYAIGPIASMLSIKYGFRPVIIGGGLLTSAGLCLSYFATSLYYLFFTFGLLTGAGLGIVYIPSISAISYYFDEKVTLASGIAASGVGVGNIVYPALIRWLVNKYDWKQSFLILGALSLHICVFGALIKPVKRLEITEKQPILDITPFKKKGYVLLCVNVFLYCCGISALYVHLVAHAETIGFDADHSAALISGLGLANLIGRFAYGAIAQHPRCNAFVLYGGSFILSGIFICLIPATTNYWVILIFALCFGLLSGCFGTLLVPILISLLGLHRFANGYGCLLIFMAAGQLIGAFLAGAMYDFTGTYTFAFVVGGALAIVSGFVMIQPYCYVKHQNKHDVIGEIEVEEKNALADSVDFNPLSFRSHRDIINMTVSLESLSAVKRILDIQRSRLSLNVPKNNVDMNGVAKLRNRGKPVNKAVQALKVFGSTDTV